MLLILVNLVHSCFSITIHHSQKWVTLLPPLGYTRWLCLFVTILLACLLEPCLWHENIPVSLFVTYFKINLTLQIFQYFNTHAHPKIRSSILILLFTQTKIHYYYRTNQPINQCLAMFIFREFT